MPRAHATGSCPVAGLERCEAHGRKPPLTPLCQRGESGPPGWTSSGVGRMGIAHRPVYSLFLLVGIAHPTTPLVRVSPLPEEPS